MRGVGREGSWLREVLWEGWQRWVGGSGWEWGKRALGIGVHSRFFVLATFDETALVLEPVGDAGR